MTTEEVWKDVVGYEGLYRVSNAGLVKRLEREIIDETQGSIRKRVVKEMLLSPALSRGYHCVSLTKNKFKKTRLVHQLVAESFIKNTENKPCVNHIDGNKENNNVTNLEWATYSENNKHAYANGLKEANKLNISQKELEVLYIENELSATTIAEMLGHSRESVLRYLKKYGIEIRTNSSGVKKEQLKEMYSEQNLSTRAIADRLGFNQSTIVRLINKYEIKPSGGIQ